MKKNVVACAVIVAALAIFGQGQTPAVEDRTQQGRFQLRQFDYDTVAGDHMQKSSDLFRIDTKTGETWKYLYIIRTGGLATSVWDKIDEPKNGAAKP